MNDIIKNIEAAQLKEVAPEFHVGDTVKVYGKIKDLQGLFQFMRTPAAVSYTHLTLPTIA